MGSSLLFLLLYAVRKLLGAVDLCVAAHQERLAEREQRASLIAVAEALPHGGLAVQYEQGQLDWLLLKPPPTPGADGVVPLEPSERRVA
ncbi:hypothetical protein AB0D45_31300 [Streptomyces sp. NPDC048352]|uniref:hypothetical protein n=1 Tax=Streptomyces sp. NPDC048352 TaxID=3154718 RepID=UPI00342B37BA